jgi:hypothetical protein
VTPRGLRAFVVFGFASTHDALAAEAALREAAIDLTPVPTPLDLGAGCGIALRVSIDDEGCATGAMAEAGIVHSGRIAVQDL